MRQISPEQCQSLPLNCSQRFQIEETMREKQTENFNSHYRSRELTLVFPVETVWVTNQWTPATVIELAVVSEIISDSISLWNVTQKSQTPQPS